MGRIFIPVRGSNCTHLDCMDLAALLQMPREGEFVCGVCSKEIKQSELQIDGWVRDMLERTPSTVVRVIVTPDGTWGVETSKAAAEIIDVEEVTKNLVVID
jgi:E3 SUMO-protein ligase PIAS1